MVLEAPRGVFEPMEQLLPGGVSLCLWGVVFEGEDCKCVDFINNSGRGSQGVHNTQYAAREIGLSLYYVLCTAYSEVGFRRDDLYEPSVARGRQPAARPESQYPVGRRPAQ